jgi:hypothetical protein
MRLRTGIDPASLNSLADALDVDIRRFPGVRWKNPIARGAPGAR